MAFDMSTFLAKSLVLIFIPKRKFPQHKFWVTTLVMSHPSCKLLGGACLKRVYFMSLYADDNHLIVMIVYLWYYCNLLSVLLSYVLIVVFC